MVSMTNLIFLLVLILIIAAVVKVSSYFYKKKLIKKINEDWGKLPESLYDLETSKLYSEFNKQKENKDFCTIDDETWKDLDLNELFKVINRTTTPIGSQILYDMLINPRTSPDELIKREKIISAFSENISLRQSVQVALLGLAKLPAKYLAYSLWHPLPTKPKYALVFYWLTAIAFWVLILSFAGIISWGFVGIIFIINSILFYLNQKKVSRFLTSFQFLVVLIKTTNKVQSIIKDIFPEISKDLNANLKQTASIANKIFSIQPKADDALAIYFNIYFLSQLTGFYSAIDNIKTNIHSLQNLFETVGYLDAMIAIASYRIQFPNYCHPVFSESEIFIVDKISHPLVLNPIPNNFSFDTKCLLVTGSNMSGKSTFLKTLGVNAILAQTFNMCFAEKYEAPFLKVISSIERSDDLINGKSYYMSEVESILRIINSSKTGDVHLFLIDEIFRGTNSIERTAGSIEVLRFLNNQKDFVIVATHDLQLTDILNSIYQNFHFRETMTDTGLFFDYKLHPGKSNGKNAIALLEYVGYPKSIVDGARKLVEK